MSEQKIPVLKVTQLKTRLRSNGKIYQAVDDVGFEIYPGETLCLVGESGCGKSVTALSLLRLLEQPSWEIEAEEILLEGKDIWSLPEIDMRKIRGNRIAMIFQEPMTSLNPVLTIGEQIDEALMLHKKNSRQEAKKKTFELLNNVGLPDAEKKYEEYPHQLSGGMRQRVMIAMALSCEPSLLIADEPTTALDVTVQAQILELLKDYQKRSGLALLLITHDFGIVAEAADHVAVMYASKLIETGEARSIFKNPRHPYTVGLLEAVPKIQSVSERLSVIPGQVPDSSHYPPGCHFAPRCSYATDRCQNEKPDIVEIEPGHSVCCFEWKNVKNVKN
jgi:peptide/nickel transport system ATP-binding protein